MRRVMLRIKGEVQGVFYRQSAKEEASRLGLRGWVKNLPDGAVAADAEGPAEAVDAFIRWCRRGPPSARVTDVEVTEQKASGEFKTFSVVREPFP